MRGYVVILCCFIAATGCKQKNSNTDALDTAMIAQDSANFTSMVWKEKSIDFGKITEGQKLDIAYHFTNTGNKPLVITSVIPGCGCTVAEKPEAPIAPGKEGVIKATFDSNNRLGTQHKSISVTANTVKTQSYELVFTADVQPKNIPR